MKAMASLLQRLRRWRAGGERAATSHGSSAFAGREFLDAEPWVIDSFGMERLDGAARIELRGWALPDPKLGPDSPGHFLINGGAFTEIAYPLRRDDVAAVIWVRKESANSGFRCSATLPSETLFPGGVLELTYVNPGQRRRVAAQQSYFFFDPDREAPAPDQPRRYRVVANNDLTAFLLSGCTDFKRLDAAAATVGGAGFAAHRRILDWGCGCGRLARYAVKLTGAAVTGCDIDVDNVAWCTANLDGKFVATKLRPPLPFADATFDAIYGLSVFTHLREPLQDAWLAELDRIAAPGALLLMTIHGKTALDYAGMSPADYKALDERIRREGIVMTGSNDQIDGFAEHEGEYVNVFHDPAYVRARWGNTFEILDILPGYIYTHDLVVMRKRG